MRDVVVLDGLVLVLVEYVDELGFLLRHVVDVVVVADRRRDGLVKRVECSECWQLTVVMNHSLSHMLAGIHVGEWRIERVVSAILNVLSKFGWHRHSIGSCHGVIAGAARKLLGSKRMAPIGHLFVVVDLQKRLADLIPSRMQTSKP